MKKFDNVKQYNAYHARMNHNAGIIYALVALAMYLLATTIK